MRPAGRLVTNVRIELKFLVLMCAAIFVARRKINNRMPFIFRKGHRSALDSERAYEFTDDRFQRQGRGAVRMSLWNERKEGT